MVEYSIYLASETCVFCKLAEITAYMVNKSSGLISALSSTCIFPIFSCEIFHLNIPDKFQDNSDEDHSPPSDKKSSVHGVPWKVSRGGFGVPKEDMGKIAAKNGFEKQGEKSDPVRKSKRVPKRRVLEEAFDEDDEDDEIRYLEKLKCSRAAGFKDSEEESSKKHRSLSRVSKGGRYENVDESGRSGKDGKKARSERGSEDTDYEEDEELLSDCEPEGKKRKRQKKDLSDSPTENKREMTLTTRQRALLYGKDVASASGASQIEFPNGLPPPPPRSMFETRSLICRSCALFSHLFDFVAYILCYRAKREANRGGTAAEESRGCSETKNSE